MSNQIAQLKYEISKWSGELEKAKSDQRDAHFRVERCRKKLTDLERQLANKDTKKVSDHAIARYFEYQTGLTREDIEELVIKSDFEKLIKNGTIVTLRRPKT